jgi:hypothetical protein
VAALLCDAGGVKRGTMKISSAIEINRSRAFHLQSKVNSVDVEDAIEEMPAGVRLVEQANVQWKFPVNVLSVLLGKKM